MRFIMKELKTKALVKQARTVLHDFPQKLKFLAGKDSMVCFQVWDVFRKIFEELEERRAKLETKNMKSIRELENVLEIEEVVEKLGAACQAVFKLSEALDFAQTV